MPPQTGLQDLKDDFQKQLQRMRSEAVSKKPPARSSTQDFQFSPTPAAAPDNTSMFLSHAKPGPYMTELKAGEEEQFQKWLKENDIPFEDSPNAGYDMRGYWKALVSGDERARQTNGKPFPEFWKTPYNKAFSNQSIYALPTAPKWQGKKLVGANGWVLFDEDKPEAESQPAPESPEGYIQKYAPVYGVDPDLIRAMMGKESGGKQSAVSPKGALGLMQLMPDTARQLGVDPDDPEDNIKGGIKYMAQLLSRFNGDMSLAIAAYHAGPGAVDKAGGIPDTSDGLSTTKDYVASILARYQKLKGSRSASLQQVAFTPTPDQKQEEKKPYKMKATPLPPDPVKQRVLTDYGAYVEVSFDRSEFKNELQRMREMGGEAYRKEQESSFSPTPGPEKPTEDWDPILHPFRFMGWLNDQWRSNWKVAGELLFQTEEDRDQEYRSFLAESAKDPKRLPQEREHYARELKDFDQITMQKARAGGYENLPWYASKNTIAAQRATVQTIADWYNPMMMALRGFHVVGEAAGELAGPAGVIARRAFYVANAAVGGKFTWDQFQGAIDKFRDGDTVGGFSDLGGAAGTAFMTAVGLAMARPKAHPEEIRMETERRLQKLQETLQKQPVFQRVQDLAKEGKIRPIFLPNLSPEDVEFVRQDLARRLQQSRTQPTDFRGPLEMEPTPSDLPFTVTDRRGQEKEEGIGAQIIDAPVLSPQEREFRRQEEREKEVLELLAREREQRERDHVGRAQKFKDELEEQLALERELEWRDKRRMAPAELVDLRERMEHIANEHMYVDAADMARSLMEKKPRGKALEPFEKDFLRLWEERKRIVRGLSGAKDVRRTRFGEEEARKEAERVETEQKLRDHSARLSKEATEARTPEEAQERGEQADEALRRAEEIRTEVDQARAEREAARQEQQEYPLGAPVTAVQGGGVQVRLPDGRKLAAHYAVVKLDDLIISHNPDSFESNPKYQPAKMQPRDYKKNKEARVGVLQGGQDFDVDSYFNTDNTGHNGPAVILSDGRVAGGNGRSMRLALAYRTDQGDAIYADLVNKAAQFGLDPGKIPSVEDRPVLVRVLDDSPTDLQSLIELGQDLNRDETRGFSASEQAVMSGERLSQDTLEWVSRRLDDMGEESSIKDLMRTRGLELAQKLIADGVISPTKRAEFVTSEGELTTRAKDMFENALLGKVINDADLIATMPKQIREKLFRSLAPLSKIKAADPAWDFADYLEEAVRHWKRIDALTETLDVYGKNKERSEQYMEFQRGKLTPEPIHPAVEALIRYLDKKPLEIKSGFYKYIDDYEGQQQTLMGVEPPNPRTSFNKNIGEKVGVEITEGEWGTIRPKPSEPKAAETVQEAHPEPAAEEDFSELADIPTDQLEADLEQLREIVDNENDPMLQAYIRELNKRPDRSPGISAQPGTEVAEMEPTPVEQQRGMEPTPAEREAEREAQSAAQQEVESIRQDIDLARELSMSGPLNEEKLRDILSRHPKYSAGKVGAVISVMKGFAEKYVGMPFDDWLNQQLARVDILGPGPSRIGELDEGPVDVLLQKPEFGAGMNQEELISWARAAGKKLNVEDLGQTQGNIFGGVDRVYRLRNPQGTSVLVTEAQMGTLREAIPELSRKITTGGDLAQPNLFEMEATPDQGGGGEPGPSGPAPGMLFQGEEYSVGIDGRNLGTGEFFRGNPLNLTDRSRPGGMAVLQLRSGGREIGFALIEGRPDLAMGAVQMSVSEVYEGERGKGHGTALYREAAKQARSNGANYLVSDKNRSADAERMWESIKEKVPNSVTEKNGRHWLDLRNQSLFQGSKGAVEFLQDGKAIIHLMENADVSTILHEFAHVARRNLKPGDAAVIQDWLKIKDGVWHVADEEKFARAFEKYLYDGEAPTPELKSVFKRIRDWMIEVYHAVKGSAINVKIPEEVIRVFDRMVSGQDRDVVEGETPKAPAKGVAVEKLRDAIRNLPRGVKMPFGGETVDFGKDNPTQADLEHWLKLLIESHVDEQPSPFPEDVSRDILASVSPKHIEAVRRQRWSDREYDSILNAKLWDDPAAMQGVARKVASYVGEKKYNNLGYDKVMPYDRARVEEKPAGRGKLSSGIEDEARRIQRVQEDKGDLVTPEDRMGATKIAEGGEALTDSMSDARMRVFPDQEQAIQWAKSNKDKLRGIELYTLQDGRGFAHFLPKDPTVLFQEVDPAEIDRRIRLIDERLQKLIPEAERARLGKMRQELRAQKARQTLSFTPLPSEVAGKTIKLWTPEGEREISNVPRRPDTERGVSNAPVQLQEPRRTEPVSERTGQSGGAEPSGSPGRDLQGPATRGGGKRADREPRKALRDVEAARLDAPVHDRGTPLYTQEAWESKLSDSMLPPNAPIATVRIPEPIVRMLGYPGQPEVVESALSGLKQHDAYIVATTQGTGKTYTGAAIISQLYRPGMKVLVLTVGKELIHQRGNGWIAVARDLDVDLEELPTKVSDPEPGIYATTYSTAIGREGIQHVQWDLVVADEIGEARKWFSSQRGAMMKTLATNAKKVLYMSATPFHTALELGHMDKLGLWKDTGFAAWGRQFGVYKDAEGNWAGGNAPKKLLKLREQLIERGQFINQDTSLEGFSVTFAQVPLSPEELQAVKNISEAFRLAEDYFKRRGRKSMIRATRGNAVTYIKKYLERSRLPQAIELAKKAEKEGWKVGIFSETKSGRSEIFDFLKEADEGLGGRISELLPPLPDVPEALEAEFSDDLANYSGPHSAARTAEKEAFLDNSKKHIYVSYAAGGIGVSLHDTSVGGKHPRMVIYLGPPYSGMMFDQAIKRFWRYGTRSDVHAVFMVSNSRPEINMIVSKVAPRMTSLRALVSGIDEQDRFVNTLRNMDSEHEKQAAYELGQNMKFDADDFTKTETTHAVQSWKDVKIESAENAKNKGMRMPKAGGHPGVIRLFQEDEHEPPEPPEDLELPEDVETQDENQRQQETFNNENAPADVPAPHRAMLGDAIALQARADAKNASESPLGAVRLRWDTGKRYVETAWDAVDGTRPMRASKVIRLYNFTNGRKLIREVGGAPGQQIAYNIAEYHIESGNIGGPWKVRYQEILRDNGISTKHRVFFTDPKTGERREVNEHHNMVMAKEGKQPPANARVARAVQQLTQLMNDMRSYLGKVGAAVEIFDEGTGQKRYVPYSELADDPHYWPHILDPDYEIRMRDPVTGHEEVVTLRDWLNGEPGEARFERITEHVMDKYGWSRARTEDFLAQRRRDVPLVGNVERAREHDVPFYKTGPDAMFDYLEGAAEAAARTKVFGQRRQKLERLISMIPDAMNRARVREVMDSLLSRRQFEDETRALVSLAADWSVLTKMTFSGLKVMGHSVHSATILDTKSFLQSVLQTAVDHKDAVAHAAFAGSLNEHYKIAIMKEFGIRGKGRLDRLSQKYLRIVGFTAGYDTGRVIADGAARIYMQKTALPKLMKGDTGRGFYRRNLKEVLHLSDEAIDSAIARGSWKEEDFDRAGKAAADKVMFTGDPTELPPNWRARADEPGADNALAMLRVATLLKGYMFKTSALLRERLWEEARKGNFRPWIPLLIMYPIIGEIIGNLSALVHVNKKRFDELMNDKESPEASLLWRAAGDIGHATGTTILYNLLDETFRKHNVHYVLTTELPEFAAGPAYSDAWRTFGLPWQLLSEEDKRRGKTAEEKRYRDLLRWLGSTVPAVGGVVRMLGPEPKKKRRDYEYRFSPMPNQYRFSPMPTE